MDILKMNSSFYEVVNDYEEITRQYAAKTGDDINRNPILSVRDFALEELQYSVSIVIPAWNSAKSLRYTLNSLAYCGLLRRFPDKTEVILVDDGSDDDIQQALLEKNNYPYKIKYIRQYHMGRAQAINMAIYHSVSDIIVFCDADLIVTPYAIDELIKRQQMFLHEAIFFGFREDVMESDLSLKIEDCLDNFVIDFEKDNRFLTDFPGLWGTNMMLETDCIRGMTCKKNVYVTNNIKGIYDCWELYRMPYGFLFSVSRENILKVGGFAEYLKGWGFDDTEFCAKCVLRGIKLIPVPSSFVGHIYHPIREKTQWIDGAKNQQRMEERLRTLNFSNYIVEELCSRIEIQKTYIPKTFCRYSKPQWYSFRCVQEGYYYHYVLGNIEKAMDILLQKGIQYLSNKEMECLCDLTLRLYRKDIWALIIDHDSQCINSFYYKLCMFVFNGKTSMSDWNDKYTEVAHKLGVDELQKRAECYFNEEQWYLALRDYFGAYLLSGDNPELLQKCKICSEQMPHNS